MPPPADRKLGRLANFDSFPLAHKSSRTTEANASRFSAQIAKRWEPGLASNGVMLTIGFTVPTLPSSQQLASGLIELPSDAFDNAFQARSVDSSGKAG
jgi:hypothetical protein